MYICIILVYGVQPYLAFGCFSSCHDYLIFTLFYSFSVDFPLTFGVFRARLVRRERAMAPAKEGQSGINLQSHTTKTTTTHSLNSWLFANAALVLLNCTRCRCGELCWRDRCYNAVPKCCAPAIDQPKGIFGVFNRMYLRVFEIFFLTRINYNFQFLSIH